MKSDDLKKGVISSTKAFWSGSDYRVELMPDGTWQVHWKNDIGNKYESPGIILALPGVDTEGMQEYVDSGAGTQEDFLSESFDNDVYDIKYSLRDELKFKLSQMDVTA